MTKNTSIHHGPYSHHHQKGVALVVSMILLAVITLLSISAMRTTNLDTKIAVNHQFKELSFQAAESAFAILTGPAPNVLTPATATAANVDNTDYFTSTGVPDQPDLSADVEMDYLYETRANKVSGFGLNILTVVYQADAVGRVAQSGTQTQNRMQVILVRN